MTEIEIKQNIFNLFPDCIKVEIIGELNGVSTKVCIYDKFGNCRQNTYYQLVQDKSIKLVDYNYNRKINYKDCIIKLCTDNNCIFDGPFIEIIKSTDNFYFIDKNTGIRYSTNICSQKLHGYKFKNCRIDYLYFVDNFLYKVFDLDKFVLLTSLKSIQLNSSTQLVFECKQCHYQTILSIKSLITLYKNNKSIKCKQCTTKKYITKRYALERIKNLHPDYDTSNMYNDKKDNDKIDVNKCYSLICNKKSRYGIIHGEFYSSYVLLVNNNCGCKKCIRSKMAEKVEAFLFHNNIDYEIEFPIKLLCDESNYKIKNQRCDFFLPKLNVVIEVQGQQHYKSYHEKINWKMFGDKQWKDNDLRDEVKILKLESENIKIIFYDDQTNEIEFKNYKICKSLEELSISLNISNPSFDITFDDNYHNHKVKKIQN